MNTGDLDPAPSQSRQTTTDGATGDDEFEDLGEEQPLDLLADALPAKRCECVRPLPAPDDGELRCTRCGHACDGWGAPA